MPVTVPLPAVAPSDVCARTETPESGVVPFVTATLKLSAFTYAGKVMVPSLVPAATDESGGSDPGSDEVGTQFQRHRVVAAAGR